MSAPLNLQLLQSTTLDSSGTYSPVTLLGADNIHVTRDAGTPAGDPVSVDLQGVSLGVSSTLTVDNGATLKLDGALPVNALSSINIGANGTLEISGTASGMLASSINFTGPNGKLILDPGVSLSALSHVGGMTTGDVIDVQTPLGATSATYQNGNLNLMSGTTPVASLPVSLDANAGPVSVQADGAGGVNIGVSPGTSTPVQVPTSVPMANVDDTTANVNSAQPLMPYVGPVNTSSISTSTRARTTSTCPPRPRTCS